MNFFPNFPKSVICLILLVDFSSSWEIATAHCAKLYSSYNFQGASFFLKDNEQIAHLNDVQKWENTSGISAKVKTSCTMTVFTEPFLRGSARELTGEMESFGDTETLQNSSVICLCSRKCRCEDVVFRGLECARGYFSVDCTHCDAFYTSFKQGGRTKLSPKLSKEVNSFVIRPHCSLTVNYKGNDGSPASVQIETNLKSDIVEFNGEITSTSCLCDNIQADAVSQDRKRKDSDPPLLTISHLRGAINAELKKSGQESHPGLLAALQSLRAKRSPKNAYILLLGLTGSGKSTAVNLLFDHPNITQVGAFKSTTTDIHEFRIPIQVNELGIKNSELRIIDTPGIADTRGITHDSQFLATLDQFLTKHEDLKRSVPNIILICVKFHENRFYGEGSAFVKMLKTIELFRDKLVDPKFSNIIFVLTHFMSETKQVQRDPGPKIQRFKQVIAEFSTLPNPIVLVVAENKPEQSELPSLNGYWQLPNGEYYPKNLFNQIQRTLTSCGDPIGLSIIQTAFSRTDPFQVQGNTFPILPPTNSKVIKYLSALSSLERPPTSNEVTEALDSAYSHLDPELKKKFPSILNHLKRVLSLKNLNSFRQIPKTTVEILKLLKEVQLNPASIFLLEKGLNLTTPYFSGDLIVGSGYDLVNDRPRMAPIFNLNANHYPSDIGFHVPDCIQTNLENSIRNVFSIMNSKNEYLSVRLTNLDLHQDSHGLENLLSNSAGTKPGMNIISSPDDPNLKLSALIEYQIFQLRLDRSANLSSEYVEELRSLGPFDINNFESVRAWNRFFQLYGTHAVVAASGGGSIEVEVKHECLLVHPSSQRKDDQNEGTPYTGANDQYDYSPQDDAQQNVEPEPDYDQPQYSINKFTRLSETMSKILQYLADNFLGKETLVVLPEDVTYRIRMRGGDPKYYISNVTHRGANGDQTVEVWNILDKWQTSVRFQPEIHTSYLKLIPMSEVLRNIAGFEADALTMESAAAAFLNASLVYVPSVVMDYSLEDRDHSGVGTSPIGDFESLQEFSKIFGAIAEESRKTQDNFLAMMREAQRENLRQNELWEKQKEEDRAADADRRKERLEEDRYKQEVQYRKEQLAAEQRKEDQSMQFQAEQAESQLKAIQASQMAQLQASNQQMFLSFIQQESQRRHEMEIARLSQKGWLDKTFDFLGGMISKTREDAQAAAPYIMAAAG